MKKLNLSQKITCNTVAKTFELAATKLSCYETTFCKQWLESALCASILEEDETVICQSKAYFFDEFLRSAKLPKHEGYKMDREAMHWIGYVLTYWMYATGISGKDIASHYNIKSILEQYEVLHTMSATAAIQTIEGQYSSGKATLDSVLYR